MDNILEEPLPAGGSCLLGSLNLSEFVDSNNNFNFDEFKKAIEISIGALNEILHEGLLLHPLEEQRNSVNDWRQIGLGIFGLHDMLIKMGIRYGSDMSLTICADIASILIDKAIETSANLTDVYGLYPMYDYDTISKSEFFIANTSDKTKELVKKKGLTNSQLLTIAPTGSIGTMLGVSTGIETIYQFSYTRKTESLHGKDEYYKVYTPIAKEYMEKHNIKDEKDLPDFFNTAMTIDYSERLKMQSIWQYRIDASISSTVNVPNEFTIEETEKLYLRAHKLGLKGVTIYRSGCKREGVLTVDTKKEEVKSIIAPISSNKHLLPWGTTIESSDDLIGLKRKIGSGCGSLHVQAYFDAVDGKLTEMFLSKGGSGGCFGYLNALSRVISAGLRTGLDFDYLIDQLQSIPSCSSYVARTVTKKDTSKGSSCPSAIGFALLDMYQEIKRDYICEEDELEDIKVIRKEIKPIEIKSNDKKYNCPECKEELLFEGGCIQCRSCGWSKCD